MMFISQEADVFYQCCPRISPLPCVRHIWMKMKVQRWINELIRREKSHNEEILSMWRLFASVNKWSTLIIREIAV